MSWSTSRPPLKAAIGVSRCEGLDEHLHAARRAAAGDGEEDAGLAQAAHRGDGVVGQDLVLGDQRPVHVGQEEADGRVSWSEAMGRW